MKRQLSNEELRSQVEGEWLRYLPERDRLFERISAKIDGMIWKRITMFYNSLIERGQILPPFDKVMAGENTKPCAGFANHLQSKSAGSCPESQSHNGNCKCED